VRVASRIPVATITGWGAALLVAASLPGLLGTPFYLHTATVALIYVVLAVAFDLVVGRIGALSLCQPVFFAWGAYSAALLATRAGDPGFWIEAVVAAVGGVALALAIGIPSFRLSLHSFAIGTLGFLLIAQLIALNWMPVTRGPLCVSGVPAIGIPLGAQRYTVLAGTDSYYMILAIAVATVAVVGLMTKSRIGSALTAVRDDPVLASARGIWPLRMRLTAFAVSAAFSGLAGVFAAHFQHVVCPSQVDVSVNTLLLVMVFIGGLASLRGVVTAAVLFTVIPQLLRVTDAWRLVIFGALLLLIVTTMPDGIEQLYVRVQRALARIVRRAGPDGSQPPVDTRVSAARSGPAP
jgi:ABC-type branched-subunit amino acid transport system permease subunit